MGPSRHWLDLMGEKISSLGTISLGIARKGNEKKVVIWRGQDTEATGWWEGGD